MERCGFFNANLVDGEYDRTYLADQFAAYFASFIGNGVYAKKSSELKVSEMTTQGMGIVVKSGQAWINGYWYENTEDKEFLIDTADGTLKRIDSVVLRWGAAERSMWLQVNKGTPAVSPVAPALVRSADYYDLQLATVYVDRAVIKITQSSITDTRPNTSVCGWVTGVVDQIDTTELFNQFETYFQEFKDGNEADFNAWFDNIKDILDESTAGNLYNMITAETNRAIEAEETKAPIAHASTATTYGVGTSSQYGHVKLTNVLNQTGTGLALTPDAIPPMVQHTYTETIDYTVPAGGNVTNNLLLTTSSETEYLRDYIPLCVRAWHLHTLVTGEGVLKGVELKSMVLYNMSKSIGFALSTTFQNNYTAEVTITYSVDVVFVKSSLFTYTGDISPYR